MRDGEGRGASSAAEGWDSPRGYIEVDPEEAERWGAFDDEGVDLEDVLDSGGPDGEPAEGRRAA